MIRLLKSIYLDGRVSLSDDSHGAGAHDVSQVVKSLDLRQPTELSPVLVAWEAVVAALLDDLGHQIQTEAVVLQMYPPLVSK